MPTPKDFQTGWPLFVLQDLVGYLQSNNYLRTAELMSDAAFTFVEEHQALGHGDEIDSKHPVVQKLRQNLN